MVQEAEKLRDRLGKLVKELGLGHPLVLECSRELDCVILQIQKQKYAS